ncbi:MAG: hypothetical protein FWF57_02965 [Defluviitaleaceae bacterium]|nr:hypothetical protein [Defluviitaleaceae bacterium]
MKRGCFLFKWNYYINNIELSIYKILEEQNYSHSIKNQIFRINSKIALNISKFFYDKINIDIKLKIKQINKEVEQIKCLY